MLIKRGQVIDPLNNINGVCDILVENGRIAKVAPKIDKDDPETIDASGKYVCPGFIDMHVHLREPGREDQETIESGSKAAARGGFTSILCMPNTKPPIDNEGLVEFVYKQAREKSVVNVYCAGCISKGRAGEELVEMAVLKNAGAIACTDDGSPVADSHLMRKALEYGAMCGLKIISHPEELYLSKNGQMNEGYTSTILGLKGIPNQAEDIMVFRDVSLSALTGAPVHITHISTAGSVDVIREAKKKGVPVTCDTTPHHLTLDDTMLEGYDTNFKVNPPLRSKKDISALIEGLKDGTIDAIATDHAPHTEHEKKVEFDYAPCGMLGLETAVGVCWGELVGKGRLDLSILISKFTSGPAKILGIPKGSLSEGACADITIIDPKKEWTVDKNKFFSKSRNTPYNGRGLSGDVILTVVSGKAVYRG